MAALKRHDRTRLGVLISGRGSNLKSLIDHFGPAAPPGPIEIALVVSNRAEAPGLAIAQSTGIPCRVVDHAAFATRVEFDRAIDYAMREAGVTFVALAGFMRILSDWFIAEWRDRLVNIHPSLLPAFKGLNTHRQALEAGVRFHGCSVHFVRPELDSGPIIAQAVVPIVPGDDEAALAGRVLRAEHRLYPMALRLIAEGKVHIDNNLVHVDDAAFANGILFNPLGS